MNKYEARQGQDRRSTEARAKRFARRWLADWPRPRVDLTSVAVKVGRYGTEIVLWREGGLQVVLTIVPAGTEVPTHRHPGVESVELGVAGTGDIVIGERPYVFDLPVTQQDYSPLACLLRIPSAAFHRGCAKTDAAFLSFQDWGDAEPSFITDRWADERRLVPA